MKKLNLIELNEINFEIVDKYVSSQPGEFPGFEKLLELVKLTSSSEKVYELLEPWIQWPSVHTCQTFDKHKIFRLGDIINYKGDQIFEKIENAGYMVGCVSPMNADNNLKNPAYFIPDPWTNTQSDNSKISTALHQALKQAVNDNSEGKVELSTYITFFWILLTRTQIKNWFTFLKLFLLRKKRWNKALFLDLLLADVFMYLKSKNNENFSCLFLNAFAHVQHHYFLNSKMYDGCLKNKPEYINNSDDPILDTIRIYDRIILDLLNKYDEKFVFATGLRQVPVDEQIVYYRLKNHEKFLKSLGVKNFVVEPRMTRDFLVKFNKLNDLEDAFKILSKTEYKRIQLFGEIEKRRNSLFITLTFSNVIGTNDVLSTQNESLNLSEEFVFVANKNAHHDSLGYVFTNFIPHILKTGDHVCNVGSEILHYFNIADSK